MQIPSVYDYLAQLTASERRILATELGYSAKYFNFLVSAQNGISEFLTHDIQKSNFNSEPSERGSRFTDKMLAQSIEALREARIKRRRGVKTKKKHS